jgi:hypothetical protein
MQVGGVSLVAQAPAAGRAKGAAQEFEALLIAQMLRSASNPTFAVRGLCVS